jgi:hypothetical protein
MRLRDICEEQQDMHREWISPDDMVDQPNAVAFIYNIDGELDLMTGGIHPEMVETNIEYYHNAYGLGPPPDYADYDEYGDYFMEAYQEYIVYSRRVIEKSAIMGRVGTNPFARSMHNPSEDGRQTVAIWNEDTSLLVHFLDDCLSALEERGVIESDPVISAPSFGVVDRGGVTKAISGDETRVNPEIEKLRQLHLMRGQEKRKAMQDAGLDPLSAEHPMSKNLKTAGLLNPGQKWWAMHSEDQH